MKGERKGGKWDVGRRVEMNKESLGDNIKRRIDDAEYLYRR